jgi:hypothetical protein
MLMDNGTEQAAGIRHMEFYVPETRYSMREYARVKPAEFTQESLEQTWRDIAIEPEILFRYFSGQIAGGRDNFAVPREAEVEKFERQSGITGVYCAGNENSSDMAVRVGRQVLDNEPGLAKSIDAVICYHSTINEMASWSTACRVQYDLGLKLLSTEPDLNTLLLVGAEKLVPPYRRVFGKMTAVGDSASAMVLSRGGAECKPLCFRMRDFPEWWNPDQYDSFRMATLIDFLAEQATILTHQVLDDLNLGREAVALFILSNFSLALNRRVGEKAKIPPEKIYSENISRFGHLLNSDLVVNLSTVRREGKVKSGDLVLVLNVGLGLSLGCAAIRI